MSAATVKVAGPDSTTTAFLVISAVLLDRTMSTASDPATPTLLAPAPDVAEAPYSSERPVVRKPVTVSSTGISGSLPPVDPEPVLPEGTTGVVAPRSALVALTTTAVAVYVPVMVAMATGAPRTASLVLSTSVIAAAAPMPTLPVASAELPKAVVSASVLLTAATVSVPPVAVIDTVCGT